MTEVCAEHIFPSMLVMESPKVRSVSFIVAGIPRTEGSTQPFRRRNGTVGVRHNNTRALREWRDQAAKEALHARPASGWCVDAAYKLDVLFVLPRTREEARTNAPFPTAPSHGDLSKLMRALEDAFTGVLWIDDRLIVDERSAKVFAEDETWRIGAHVSVSEVRRAAPIPADVRP